MNVFDYLDTFGNKSFKKKKFSETDSLIFSSVSYLKWERVFDLLSKGRKMVPIKEVLNLPNGKELLTDGTSNPEAYGDLWDHVIKTERFGTLLIGNLKTVFSVEDDVQFFAMTFKSEGWQRFLVFRGTDGTLVGWKEDCNLIVLKEIPAEVEAAKYIDETVRMHLYPFHIIGHSKGGNLATYSSLKMKKRYRWRLKGVYNHDGPGFDDLSIFDPKDIKKLAKKEHKLVPGESVIGLLLKQPFEYKICEAEKAPMWQHSIFKWNLDEKGDLVLLEDRTQSSKTMEKIIKDWLDPMPHDDRELLVNTLFEILRWDGRTTLYEVTSLSKVDILFLLGKLLFKFDSKKRAFLIKNVTEFLKIRKAAQEEVEGKGKKKKK